MYNNLSEDLIVSARTTLGKRAFTLKEGDIYRNYTEQVTCAMGDLVSKNFHGVNFEEKTRVKSTNSMKNKIEKNALKFAKKQVESEKLLDINDFSLFDIYGGKFVVLSVSDDFHSDYLSIDGFLSKRKKSRELLEKAQNQSYGNNSQEIIRLNHVIYNEIDTMCQRYVSSAICKFIVNDDTLAKDFGIYSIKNRYKDYNLENEYIAKHITLGSSKLPGWYMELQFKSLKDYDIARTGAASHSNRPGKDIHIPEKLSDIDIQDIPEYFVYAGDSSLYFPSKKECIFHYLSPAFNQKKQKNPNPENLLNLFKNFSEDENGFFKKFDF